MGSCPKPSQLFLKIFFLTMDSDDRGVTATGPGCIPSPLPIWMDNDEHSNNKKLQTHLLVMRTTNDQL